MRLSSTVLSLLLYFLFSPAGASPADESAELRQFYQNIFPTVPLEQFSNGIYAINEEAHAEWQEIEQFPPYEEAITQGKALFDTPFQNGKQYKSCFENGGTGIAHRYPYWNSKTREIITLPLAINNCRIKNDEPPLQYKKGEITLLLAYMAFTSRNNRIETTVPKGQPEALEAFKRGKAHYYQRRGQLNFSCATCHIQNAGRKIRSETLSPMLGHTSGWPVFRAKWGELGTLHRRFIGCNNQARAKPFKAQSTEYRELEYYISVMGHGLPLNGPSYRN